MKRLIVCILALACVISGVGSTVSAAGSDVSIRFFDAQYYLGADKEGRSTLKTVESIVAEFPNTDSEHGLKRLIAKNYDGHPTDIVISSIKDAKGNNVFYSLNDSADGDLIVQIGSPSKYVHGEQKYILTYTQRDVTKYLKDVPDDEFGWDITGTNIEQPIQNTTATVHLSTSIKPTFTKKVSCSDGATACTATTDGATVSVKATNIPPYSNVSLKVGFTPGTFRGYEQAYLMSTGFLWIIAALTALVAGLCIWGSSRLLRRRQRLRPRGTIKT